MGSCGSCRHSAVPPRTPAQLFRIRRGYRARWRDLALSVEDDSSQWTLCVRDCGGDQVLYIAHRGGAGAAQLAAAEFAILSLLGPATTLRPEQLAKELTWQEYW